MTALARPQITPGRDYTLRNGERVRVTGHDPAHVLMVDIEGYARRGSTIAVFTGVFVSDRARCSWHAPSGVFIASNGKKPHKFDIVAEAIEQKREAA